MEVVQMAVHNFYSGISKCSRRNSKSYLRHVETPRRSIIEALATGGLSEIAARPGNEHGRSVQTKVQLQVSRGTRCMRHARRNGRTHLMQYLFTGGRILLLTIRVVPNRSSRIGRSLMA